MAVPEFYYKMILAPLYANEADRATPEDAENVIALGFIFPNEKCTAFCLLFPAASTAVLAVQEISFGRAPPF